MGVNVNINFEHLIQAIKQLPHAQIMQLKAEISEMDFRERHTQKTEDFQKSLLSGPVMPDKHYKNYKSRFKNKK